MLARLFYSRECEYFPQGNLETKITIDCYNLPLPLFHRNFLVSSLFFSGGAKLGMHNAYDSGCDIYKYFLHFVLLFYFQFHIKYCEAT